MKLHLHNGIRYFIKAVVLTCNIILFTAVVTAGTPAIPVTPGKVTSTQQQAIDYVEKIRHLKPSPHWPNIKPALFFKKSEDQYS
ncbi:MAG: hypothetical protein IPI88_03620 [Chitinophagaceae bacterium]|nr:hypothetical protein [Chitinophagaceae bacterium]